MCCLQETHFRPRYTNRLKVRGWKKIFHANGNQKKAGGATLISDKIDEWTKKMWNVYTMEYYSAIKRNEIELFVVRWMDLESVIQSEVSQKDKNKYRMLPHIYGI